MVCFLMSKVASRIRTVNIPFFQSPTDQTLMRLRRFLPLFPDLAQCKHDLDTRVHVARGGNDPIDEQRQSLLHNRRGGHAHLNATLVI